VTANRRIFMRIDRMFRLGVMLLPMLAACSGEGLGDDELATGDQDAAIATDAAALGKASTVGGGFKVIKPPIGPIGPVQQVKYADLKLDGTMRFYGWESPVNGTVSAQIDVTNIGNAPATGATGSVYAANVVRPGALYQYWGGTATAPNTVNPGERGYVLMQIPISFIRQCQSVTVELDLDHTMQYEQGYSGVFSNDLGQARTQCLTWDSPITTDLLGHVPDPLLQNKRLSEIVGSFVQGSPAGLCSNCHHAAATGRRYSPDVAQGAGSNIRKTDVIDGQAWGFAGGWVDDFAAVSWKPADLKLAFQIWAANGSP